MSRTLKNILSWLFIIIGLAALVISTSKPAMKAVWDSKYYEYNTTWWGEHYCNGGDLANMAYLDDIARFQTPKNYHFVTPADSGGQKKIDLYLWGDSYLEEFPGSAFGHIGHYYYARSHYFPLYYKLDTTRKNVLIIEAAERFVRSYYGTLDIFNMVKQAAPAASLSLYTDQPVTQQYGGFAYNVGLFFNSNINQNLEFLLCNYNFLNKPRLLKADLNYKLFNRGSGSVVISDDGSHLFIKETLMPNSVYSCYQPVDDKEVKRFVDIFNEIYQHYKQEGFAEVYLAVIPNPVSIIQPHSYNYFLPRMLHHPDFKMPTIDYYSVLKQHTSPQKLFRAGDTHWNNDGAQLWLQMVNDTLRAQDN